MSESVAQRIQVESELIDVSLLVKRAQERLARLSNLKLKVGIIRMWPDQAVAEHENIERFRSAFKMIGVEIVELDRYGIIIGSPNDVVTANDVDFVIHLHFETGKTYDVTSVAAMWNPAQFYVEWGFKRFWANQMSHDIFAYTGSDEIKSLIYSSYGPLPEYSFPILNHTLANPIYAAAKKDDYKVFYCGINWEKISGKKGRHDEILKALDAKGLIDIYGPEEIQGKKVWDGFAGYKGSLPFDGKRVIQKIAKAGACLVFSSEAHISSNIMSNRLFEALAGGAIVIGDEHPFIREAIGDNFICVPSWLSVQKRNEIIENALNEFNENPQKALDMAANAQKVFLEKFFLCDQLVSIYESVANYEQDMNSKLDKVEDSILDIIIQPSDNDANRIVANIRAMKQSVGELVKLHVCIDEAQFAWFQEHLGSIATIHATYNLGTKLMHPAECLEVTKGHLHSPKVMFMSGIETIFGKTLVTAALELKDTNVARLGYGIKHFDAKGEPHVDFQDPSKTIEEIHQCAPGTIMYDAQWLRDNAFCKFFTWRDILKVVESKEEGITCYVRSCMIVNLQQFEIGLNRGMSYEKAPYDYTNILAQFTSIKKNKSSGVQVHLLDKPISERPPEINSQVIYQNLQNLPNEQKLGLVVDLYNAIPLPKWIRSLVTFTRRRVGIK